MRIGVLTGGGDCPGLNAVIRAIVRKAELTYRDEIIGFADGWLGVIEDRWTRLDIERVRGILPRGGTMLGTSRVQPFGVPNGVERVWQTIADNGIDAIISVGGEGTLAATAELFDQGLPVVGVPKTIDNDIEGTDLTFGFVTAVEIATEAIDRLHTTAESHNRVIVVEVMGRNTGHIATWAGIAGGAAITLVPEEPFDIDSVCRAIVRRHESGRYATIVVVAEGARPVEGTLDIGVEERDQYGHVKLDGIANIVASEIGRRTGIDTKVTILGYVQRGGTPSAFDRVLCSWLGVAAVDAVHDGAFGMMMSLRGATIARVPLDEIKGKVRHVDPVLIDAAKVFFA